MAKRIYWQTMKEWAIKAGVPAGIASFTLLFMYLSFLSVINITNYSSDLTCAGIEKDPCIALIEFSVTEDIFLYPTGYDPYGKDTPFYTDKGLKSWKMFRNWGTGWREIKLNETCTGTWCGGTGSTNKYSFAFRKGKNYTIKIEALKEDPYETVKWGFGDIDPFWYGINATPTIQATNITIELGSKVNITANMSGVSSVCVDVDHPDYGNAYACGTPSANFEFNISYFVENQFNNSQTYSQLTFTGGDNQTAYIRRHQYDEIYNFSLNLTGYLSGSTYPEDVILYINNTQEKIIGPLRPPGTPVYLNQTNSSTLPETVLSSTNGTVIRYLRLPKKANVTSAFFNWTPYSTMTTLGDCGSSGYCSNSSKNWTVCGETDGVNPPACDNDANAYDSNFSSYAMSTSLGNDASTGYTLHNLNFSWDTPNPAYLTWGVRYSGTVTNGNDGSLASRLFYFQCYDYNYGTWRTLETRQCVTGSGAAWCQGTTSPYYEVFIIKDDTVSPFGGCLAKNPIQIRLNTTVSLPEADDNAYAYTYELDTIPAAYGIRWWNTTTHSGLFIDIGIQDGVYESNYSGQLQFGNSTKTSNFSNATNTYLNLCTEENGYCLVPIYITVTSGGGKLWLSDLNVTYTYNPNPIYLGINSVKSFLGNSSGFANLPIKLYSSTAGIINISGLNLHYAGGNDTILITVYESGQEGQSKNNFNNSLTIENLTYTGKQNLTRYLSLHKYSDVNSAFLNLSGWNDTTNYDNTGCGYKSFYCAGYAPFTVNGCPDDQTECAEGDCCANLNGNQMVDNYDFWTYGSASYTGGSIGYKHLMTFHYPVIEGIDINLTYSYGLRTCASGGCQAGYRLYCYDYNALTMSMIAQVYTATPSTNVQYNSSVMINSTNYAGCLLNNGGNLTLRYEVLVAGAGGGTSYTDIYGVEFDQTSTNPALANLTLYLNNTNIWSYIGTFNQVNNRTSDFSSTLNTALNSGSCDCSGCVLSGNNCTMPLIFSSNFPGIWGYSDINVSYDIIADKSVNETFNILNFRSSYNKVLPYTWTEDVFFLPKTNSAKNVSAYGQTSTIPLFNMTMTNYGGKNANLSIRVNETFSCLNLTWNLNSTKPSGNKINTSYQQIRTNLEYLNNTKIWLWADLTNCNASDRRILRPKLDIYSYCTNCIWN